LFENASDNTRKKQVEKISYDKGMRKIYPHRNGIFTGKV